MKKLRCPVLELAFVGLFAIQGFAQTNSTPSANSDEDVLQLSPFVIEAEEDAGWVAKKSLSGSRMKVGLDDLSLPLDIITPELMEDFNILQQEDLFNIVSNMEDRNDNFLSGVYESGASFSIRGFVGVRTQRNFMESGMTFDRYNSTRVVASKGPNAILYGSGAGGGSISFFTKRFMLGSRDRTDIRLSGDSNGSWRGEINVNKGLIENKLGINFSAFTDNKRFFIKPSLEDRSGQYGSVTFKPFENTLINASYETRTEHVFRPASDYTTLIDYFSTWDNYGNPGVNGPLTSNTGNLLYPDGATGRTDVRNFGLARQSAALYTIFDGQIIDFRNTGVTDIPPTAKAPAGQRSMPVTNWPKDVGPTGLNGGAEVRTEAMDLNIEQKINEDFYLTAAIGKTDNARDQFQHRIRQLRKDPNVLLPGGSPNPHYGDYYLDLGNVNYFDRSYDTETVTLMAAYELDLERDFHKWAGKHNFAYMWQKQTALNTNIRQTMLLVSSPDPSYSLTNVNDAAGRLNPREYIEWGGYMSDYRYVRTEGFEQDGYRWEKQDGVGGSGWSSIETTSNMFVMQSSWLKNRINTSLGYRPESVDQYVVNFANNPAMQNRQTAYEHYTKAQSEDPTYVKVLTDEVRPSSLPSVPWESVKGISKNLGVVLKITPNIALTANKSQNISGSAGRNGIFGRALPNSNGRSQDYGIRFNLFDNKIRLEYTNYETKVVNSITQASGGSIRAPYLQAQDIWETMHSQGLVQTNVFLDGENWDTRDFVATGHEVMITGDPIRNLNLRLSVTKNEKVASNLGGTFMPWWNENQAAMQAFTVANPDAINPIDTDSTPDPMSFQWSEAQRFLALRADLEGREEINVPIYAAKLVAKYRFTEGFLRGHEMGTNVAWRGKMKSNYFRQADGTSDYENPFYTTDTTFVNLFWNYSKKLEFAGKPVTWKLQLNVNNAFNNYTSIARNFFNTVNGDLNSEVIRTGIRRTDPRVYSLTNTFSF